MPHIHEKMDITAEVFIVCDKKVLLRKHDKYNKWLSVGGHVELDETPDVAAIREVKEEVGLDVTLLAPRKIPLFADAFYTELIPPWYMNVHSINETHKHTTLVYFATSESKDVVPEKKDDVWQWLSKEDLERNELNIEEQILFYAKEALKAIN